MNENEIEALRSRRNRLLFLCDKKSEEDKTDV